MLNHPLPDPTFYDVYTNLAEMHLTEVGLSTTWIDVDLTDTDYNALGDRKTSDVWGNTRVYFSLPIYRLPIAQIKQ